MSKENLDKIPNDIKLAIRIIRLLKPGKERDEWIKGVNKWVGDDERRKNYVDAMLDTRESDLNIPDQTHPIQPSNRGTGLKRQGKKPRDLS